MSAGAVGQGAALCLELPGTAETVSAGLAFWAERTPQAPAIRSVAGHTLTFAALQQAAAGVAARLGALGIGEQARVATALSGGVEACAALLGAMSVGAVVPFNPEAAKLELIRDMGRLRLDVVVTDGMAQSPARQAATALGIRAMAVADLVSGDALALARADPAAANPAAIAAILHTSGTTGLPKRVPRDHRSFVASARAARQSCGLTPDDVALLVSGIHTIAGLNCLLFALLSGGSCIVAPRFDPAQVPAWIATQGATWAPLNATELNLILHAAERAGQTPNGGVSRFRAIRAESQPMTPGTAERAEACFGAAVFTGYGLSEASQIAKSGPGLNDRRPGSCGRLMSGVIEARILDDTDNDVAAGASGAIVVRGPTVFAGYLDDPEANAAAFTADGWFRTGDIGSLDADGFLYLQGRQGEIINRGGEKIAPAEIDEVLHAHPAVHEAAVFSIPDPRFGEELVAAIVPFPGQDVTQRELRAWMLDRLSPAKLPRRFWMVEALPRTASGKVQRGELARRWDVRQR